MENSDSPPPTRIPPKERDRLVALFRKSGLRQVEFAKQNGIKIHTLHRWLYHPANKRRRPLRGRAAFQEVGMLPNAAPMGWAAEVTLNCGVTLRVAPGAKPELVSFLIETLGRSAC